jgi:arylsulfatase A-like enzyme
VVDETVSLVDIFPTLLDLTGVQETPWLDGESLVPLIENPDLEWGGSSITFMYGSWSLRTDDYRYIRYEDGSEELYDLRVDTQQHTNLADDAD